MIDERPLAQMNGEHVLPPDAGPAWRAAHEAGLDMSLIEGALRLTPEQRLAEHQQVLYRIQFYAAVLAICPILLGEPRTGCGIKPQHSLVGERTNPLRAATSQKQATAVENA